MGTHDKAIWLFTQGQTSVADSYMFCLMLAGKRRVTKKSKGGVPTTAILAGGLRGGR